MNCDDLEKEGHIIEITQYFYDCLVLVLAAINTVADIFQLAICIDTTSRINEKNKNIEMTFISNVILMMHRFRDNNFFIFRRVN